MLPLSLLGAAPALWCLALAGLPHEGVRKHKLRVAEARWASSARSRLATALKSPDAKAYDLAVLLAAEERFADDVDVFVDRVDSYIASLTEAASSRLRLGALIGGDPSEPGAIAQAVSTTLFGSGAPDDCETPFFAGSAQASYHDPANSFLDSVLERRVGIPISLSVIYAECCGRLGLDVVGLNAPAHLLVAPADSSIPFVVDPFDGGSLLDLDSAAALVARNAGYSTDLTLGGAVVDGGAERGRILLTSLRRRPMTAQMWCSRMLRNLRSVHTQADDVVRVLGAAERLRLVGQASAGASSPAEQMDCAVQQAYALWALRWDSRRGEARQLLVEMLREGSDLPPDDRAQVAGLLADGWFHEDGEAAGSTDAEEPEAS